MDLSYLYPDCECCPGPSWLTVQGVMDSTPDPVGGLIERKYLQSRAVQDGANPRAKYHRKPLPWGRKKLERIGGWREDADEYRRYLWDQHREGDIPTIKRIPKPHLLKAVDEHIRRHRWFRCRCSYCREDIILGRRRERHASVLVAINEGRAIAASDKRLPGDPASSWRQAKSEVADDNTDNDELSHPGVPHESEHEQGPGFHLDHIIHDEPVYRVRYRPAWRRKRQAFPARQCVAFPAGSNVGNIAGPMSEPWECSSPDRWDWAFVDREQDDNSSSSVWPGEGADDDSQFSDSGDHEWLVATANVQSWEISESDDW